MLLDHRRGEPFENPRRCTGHFWFIVYRLERKGKFHERQIHHGGRKMNNATVSTIKSKILRYIFCTGCKKRKIQLVIINEWKAKSSLFRPPLGEDRVRGRGKNFRCVISNLRTRLSSLRRPVPLLILLLNLKIASERSPVAWQIENRCDMALEVSPSPALSTLVLCRRVSPIHHTKLGLPLTESYICYNQAL